MFALGATFGQKDPRFHVLFPVCSKNTQNAVLGGGNVIDSENPDIIHHASRINEYDPVYYYLFFHEVDNNCQRSFNDGSLLC